MNERMNERPNENETRHRTRANSLKELDLPDAPLDPLLLPGTLVEQRLSENEKLGAPGLLLLLWRCLLCGARIKQRMRHDVSTRGAGAGKRLRFKAPQNQRNIELPYLA